MTVDFFWYWSPHMDYPGDSVMARASTLVGLSLAKNCIWFRWFLAEIFFVKWRQKKCAVRCSCMWWDEFGCPLHVIRGGELAAPIWAGMMCPSNVASRKDVVFLLWQSDCLQSLARYLCLHLFLTISSLALQCNPYVCKNASSVCCFCDSCVRTMSLFRECGVGGCVWCFECGCRVVCVWRGAEFCSQCSCLEACFSPDRRFFFY